MHYCALIFSFAKSNFHTMVIKTLPQLWQSQIYSWFLRTCKWLFFLDILALLGKGVHLFTYIALSCSLMSHVLCDIITQADLIGYIIWWCHPMNYTIPVWLGSPLRWIPKGKRRNHQEKYAWKKNSLNWSKWDGNSPSKSNDTNSPTHPDEGQSLSRPKAWSYLFFSKDFFIFILNNK